MKQELKNRLSFSVTANASGTAARAARFTTLHNEVLTPVFMPVATFAALRTQNTATAAELAFPVLLANTYHLMLRPGTEVFRRYGDIHRFMNWPRSVLTDSGGFQIFSLSKSFSITEEGARFRSYLDGTEHLLSPEKSIETQRAIGSDIMMALDQCIASTSAHKDCLSALELTARWAERSLKARGDSPQSIFGIVQGGTFEELRKISAAQITALPFDGYAIGGLAVGESDDERKDMTELTASLLPQNMPRYLMGVGTPIDLLEAVHRGVDMFDCILPTALGQQGVAYTAHGKIELRRSVHKLSNRPLDETCSCTACREYSRGYLHHLIKCDEYFGAQLIGAHNLHFYKQLMDSMREHIIAGSFASYYRTMREELVREDSENPITPPKTKYRRDNNTLGDYEVIEQNGFYSIRHRSSGEVMHSVTDPMIESHALYAAQAELETHLTEENAAPFVIWDVGLGAASNAMATILELEKINAEGKLKRAVSIISFERDLDSLRLALRNPSKFPHIRHAAPAAIASCGTWSSELLNCTWILLEGDFTDRITDAEAPDCIYFDPFSLHTDTPLWSPEMFCTLFSRAKQSGTKLLTYSAATQVRSSLLSAGFYVAKGKGSGPKSETTVAFSQPRINSGTFEFLSADWLERWKRSSARVSTVCSDDERRAIEQKILDHPQFN